MVFLAKPDFVLEERKERVPSSGGKSSRILVGGVSAVPRQTLERIKPVFSSPGETV